MPISTACARSAVPCAAFGKAQLGARGQALGMAAIGAEEALRVSCVMQPGVRRVTELHPHPKAPGCSATQESMKSQLMNKQSEHSGAFHHCFSLLKFYTSPVHISSAFSSPFASQGLAVAISHAAQHQRRQGEQGPEVVWIRHRREVRSRAY